MSACSECARCVPTDAYGEPVDVAADVLADADALVDALHELMCSLADLTDAAADFLRAAVVDLWAPDVQA